MLGLVRFHLSVDEALSGKKGVVEAWEQLCLGLKIFFYYLENVEL